MVDPLVDVVLRAQLGEVLVLGVAGAARVRVAELVGEQLVERVPVGVQQGLVAPVLAGSDGCFVVAGHRLDSA
jgi:hypothetical protein